MKRVKFQWVLSVTVLGLLLSPLADLHAVDVYWADDVTDKIHKADLSVIPATAVDVIVSLSSPQALALDLSALKVYWAEAGNVNKIKRADLDGSNVQVVVEGITKPQAIALDTANTTIYWGQTKKIQKADYSIVTDVVTATAVEVDVGSLNFLQALALDLSASKVYWAQAGNVDEIKRANLDGTCCVNVLVEGVTGPRAIALDTANTTIYWADEDTDIIHKADYSVLPLPVTAVDVVTGLDDPKALALDLSASKVYWAEAGAVNKIKRANLVDGSNVQVLVEGVTEPRAIDLDTSGPTLVKLSAFTAIASEAGITLHWRTEIEVDNAGFAVYRSEKRYGEYQKLAFLNGAGDVEAANEYEFVDKAVKAGKTYYYYLEDIDLAGKATRSDIIKVSNGLSVQPKGKLTTPWAKMKSRRK